MSFSALGRLQNNKIAHLHWRFFSLDLQCVCHLICINSRYLNQSLWDSDITQKNSIWLSFCSFWRLTTKTSPTQAKVAFNFRTVLLHRKMWASLPFWQIQSNLSPICWLSQSQVTCLSIFETILYYLLYYYSSKKEADEIFKWKVILCAKHMSNLTNVQLCLSQVDKGKSDIWIWYMMVLGQHGAVLVGTWWYWISVTWYCLVLSGTRLLPGFYACIYWKKWRFGQMLP